MSDTPFMLWCYVQGDKAYFPVIASSAIPIGVLQEKIKEEKSNLLQGVDASSLTLRKVRYTMVSK